LQQIKEKIAKNQIQIGPIGRIGPFKRPLPPIPPFAFVQFNHYGD
jgi:hypothetical protein